MSSTPTATTLGGLVSGLTPIATLPPFTKIFPVSGAACATASGDTGVCWSQADCDAQGGTKDGNCNTILFNSSGVCCSCKSHSTGGLNRENLIYGLVSCSLGSFRVVTEAKDEQMNRVSQLKRH